MPISQTQKQITMNLAALAKSEIRSWAKIGLLLDQVDHSGYWQRSASSFTEWLRALSPSLNLKEASLWRYLAAARYYQQLHKSLTGRGVTSPSLDKLSNKVSPENIEILSKLDRATPDDVFLRLAQQVFAGTITRAELREAWKAYRPVMAGRTARGLGVPIPRINPADPLQTEAIQEANLHMALSASGAEWTGIERPERYELFMHVSPEFPHNVRQRLTLDAVAIVQAHKLAPLEFHGIEIMVKKSLSSSTSELLKQKIFYCDFMWVAFRGHRSELGKDCIPEHVGLMVPDMNGIQVLRPAQRTQQSGRRTGDLAKGLLLKVFGR